MTGLAFVPTEEPSLDTILGRAVESHRAGRLMEAIFWYQQALSLRPGAAELYNNLAAAFLCLNRDDAAIQHYQAAIALRPRYARAHLGLGTLFQNRGRYLKAVDHYRQALEIDPDQPATRFNLGLALQFAGDAEAAAACFREVVAAIPDRAQSWSQLLLCLNYLSSLSPAEVFDAHRRFGALYEGRAMPAAAFANPREPERRLRIGYLSVEFRRHLGEYFLLPVLEAADREQFEVHCYSALPHEAYDEHTRRFQSLATSWTSVTELSDEALAARIRGDRIDILVDLAGHSGLNRLPALALRLAPVQLTWLGYANTTGLAAIDGRLVDAITDPEGSADACASERLIRLPRPFLSFRPPSNIPETGPLPALAASAVTFGSFNALPKLTPAVIELWGRILVSVPGSRLLLKDRALDCPDTAERITCRFEAAGVARDRLVLVGWVADHDAHLTCYRQVDIALDPFPYNGTITTCDALLMGVPVVTLQGDRHAARVGASLLDAIGLSELIAGSPQAYHARAVALAADLPRLAALRTGMRERLRASPLCDTTGFTRRLERVYRDQWRRWCAGAGA